MNVVFDDGNAIKNFKKYESKARVYNVSSFEEKFVSEDEHVLVSESGKSVLVYKNEDIDYLLRVYEQLDYENQRDSRSLEDEVYDQYEEKVSGKNPTPFKAIIQKKRNDQVFDEFKYSNEEMLIPFSGLFNKDEASKNGSPITFSPFKLGKTDNAEKANHVIITYWVPVLEDESEKGAEDGE